MQNPQTDPVLQARAHPASMPPWLIVLLLLLGMGAAGAYLWKELGTTPQRKSLPQSLKIDPRAEVRPDRATNLTTGPSPTSTTRRVSGRRAPLPPLPQGKDPGPTLVSLKLSNVPAEQAMEELAKQIGASVVRDPNSGWNDSEVRTVSIDVDKVPFWSALREVFKQAGVDVPSYYYGRGGEDLAKSIVVSRNYSQYHRYPLHQSGSFAIIPSTIYRTFTANLIDDGRRENETMNIQLAVMAEPKLGVIDIANEAVLEEAVDENGKSLLRRSSRGYSSSDSNRLPWFSIVNVRLYPPADVGKRIARVKGYISAVTKGKNEDFVIEDPLSVKDMSKTFGGLPVEFRYLRKEGSDLRAKFTVHGSSADPRVRAGFGQYATVTHLYDEAGVAYRSSSSGASYSSNTFEFYVNYLPEKSAGEPKKLVVSVPADMTEIRVPFEFKDLTMP